MEEKRKAYKKMLQRNEPEEVREQRKREYRDSKALVKRLVRENKERVDEDFGRVISRVCGKQEIILERSQEGNGRDKE